MKKADLVFIILLSAIVAIVLILVIIVSLVIVAPIEKNDTTLPTSIINYDINQNTPTEWTAVAHRYHGISHSSWNVEKGEWYFMRDDRYCRLFTQPVLDVIERQGLNVINQEIFNKLNGGQI